MALFKAVDAAGKRAGKFVQLPDQAANAAVLVVERGKPRLQRAKRAFLLHQRGLRLLEDVEPRMRRLDEVGKLAQVHLDIGRIVACFDVGDCALDVGLVAIEIREQALHLSAPLDSGIETLLQRCPAGCEWRRPAHANHRLRCGRVASAHTDRPR